MHPPHDATSHRSVLAGVLVGGSSTRMGGFPKGLLEAPEGDVIVTRWVKTFDALGVPSVLVGRRPEYAHLGLETLDDEPAGIGPLGGVVALLRAARAPSRRYVVAVACDMPFVSPELTVRLLAAPDALAVAPRIEGRWQPLFCRFDAAGALPIAVAHAARGEHSLQRLLDALGAMSLSVTPDEARLLGDWDTPSDRDRVDRGRGAE